MLSALILGLVEWLISKGFIAAEGAIASWIAQNKELANLAKNQVDLQSAINSKDKDAIDKAGENSLNNSPKP